MQIGYIGLGKMGFGQVARLLENGHDVVAWNRGEGPRKKAEKLGAKTTETLEELCKSLKAPRILWLMLPHQVVDITLDQLIPYLKEGDTVIDGGNSLYLDSMRRSKKMTAKRFQFLDVGTSGGPSGARNGACLMIGGEKKDFDKLKPLWEDLSKDGSFEYFGKHGAGHFVKMVHNGIEYGMMQAIGEGFEVMKKSEFNLDLKRVADLYNKGSVVESRLVGWLAKAYAEDSTNLSKISGEISHSGEGQWTVEAAKRIGVPVPVIEKSLDFRVKSKGNPSYTGQVVSALRNQFGGHDVTSSN